MSEQLAPLIDVAFARAFVDTLRARWDAEEFERLMLDGDDGPVNMTELVDKTSALAVDMTLSPGHGAISALDALRIQKKLDRLDARYPSEAAAARLAAAEEAGNGA